MKSGATPDEKNEGKWTYRLSNKVTLPRLDPQYLQKRRKRKKKKNQKFLSLKHSLSLSVSLQNLSRAKLEKLKLARNL